MCKAMEELILDERKQSAIDLLRLDKLTYEEIALCSRLSVEEIKELAEEYGL